MGLRECPICHTEPTLMYSCGGYLIHCSDGCISPMCDHPSKNTVVLCWNDWAEWAEQHCVEPEARELTLDELRGMDGKPVWCVENPNFVNAKSGWGILGDGDAAMTQCFSNHPQWLSKYGENWWAFTRKPKGGV